MGRFFKKFKKILGVEKKAILSPPDCEICNKCKETLWELESLSHDNKTAVWACAKCGNKIKTSINEKTNNNSNSDVDTCRISRYIPKRVQREVWRRDQGRCVECGSKKNIEYDHIIPLSRGGSNTVRNIQLLCQNCNRKKCNKPPGSD